MSTRFLQKDLGGVLKHTMRDLPGDGARWDSSPAPTVTLMARGGGELLASTAATLGGTYTTGGAISVGDTTISVNSTTGLSRWDEVVLGPNAAGQWEWKTLDGVSSTAIVFHEKAVYAYSTGKTLKSHTMSVEVTSGTVGSVSQNNYAEWHYAVDSVERKEHTLFHISLYAPRLSLTAARFLEEYPRALGMLGSNQKIDALIRRMWDTRVIPDIARIFHPGAMVSGEAAELALANKLKEFLENEAKNYDAADRYAVRYNHALDQIRDGLVDLDESGGVGDTEVVRSARTPRLIRG